VTTFALVHGAGDGAWIWEKLIPEVEALGHRAVAMDLPCDDIDATADDDVAAIVSAIPSDAGDDVVAVAHATNGLLMPALAQRRPLRHVVYVCAVVPSAGKTFADLMGSEPDMFVDGGLTATYKVDDLGRSVFEEEQLVADFAVDCPIADARRYAKLSRPQRLTSYMETVPALPDVPSTYVVGTEDITLNPEWSRRAARERLGANVVEMQTGHTPMLRDPAGLARVLASTVD
jgi:pimeloyl-ACP methyl ester carboxylesterase